MGSRGIYPLGVTPGPADLRLAPRLGASVRKWVAAAPYGIVALVPAAVLVRGDDMPAWVDAVAVVLVGWLWLLAATAIARETFEELRGNRLSPWTGSVRFAWNRRMVWWPVSTALGCMALIPLAGFAVARAPGNWAGALGWIGGIGFSPVMLLVGCSALVVGLALLAFVFLGPAVLATTGEGWVDVLAAVLGICVRRTAATALVLAATPALGIVIFVVDAWLGTAWVHLLFDPGRLPEWGFLSFSAAGSPAMAGATLGVRIFASLHATSTVAAASVIGYLWLRRSLDGVCLLERPDVVGDLRDVPHAAVYVDPTEPTES